MTVQELYNELAEKYAEWLWYCLTPSKELRGKVNYELEARRKLWRAFIKYNRAYWKEKNDQSDHS